MLIGSNAKVEFIISTQQQEQALAYSLIAFVLTQTFLIGFIAKTKPDHKKKHSVVLDLPLICVNVDHLYIDIFYISQILKQ